MWKSWPSTPIACASEAPSVPASFEQPVADTIPTIPRNKLRTFDMLFQCAPENESRDERRQEVRYQRATSPASAQAPRCAPLPTWLVVSNALG